MHTHLEIRPGIRACHEWKTTIDDSLKDDKNRKENQADSLQHIGQASCGVRLSTSSSTRTMTADEEYDKLTPEEREARDKLDRAREAEDQAGVDKSL
jgi:hypothetical protein